MAPCIGEEPIEKIGGDRSQVLGELEDLLFGVLRTLLAGIVLLTTRVMFALSGTGFYNFTALILLGVGWNFLYISGTNLTRTYSTAEKGKARATNDLTIFIVGLTTSLGAGVLQNTIG